MLEATCAVPQYKYRHLVRCDNQGPGKRTAPQPWDKQRSPTVSSNLGEVIIWLVRLTLE